MIAHASIRRIGRQILSTAIRSVCKSRLVQTLFVQFRNNCAINMKIYKLSASQLIRHASGQLAAGARGMRGERGCARGADKGAADSDGHNCSPRSSNGKLDFD